MLLSAEHGWTYPDVPGCSAQDEKIYRRELLRLELSLKQLAKDGFLIVLLLCITPFFFIPGRYRIYEIMHRYGVKVCLYGHLHGRDHCRAFSGIREGITYYFIASDYLKFSPLLIDLQDRGAGSQ